MFIYPYLCYLNTDYKEHLQKAAAVQNPRGRWRRYDVKENDFVKSIERK